MLFNRRLFTALVFVGVSSTAAAAQNPVENVLTQYMNESIAQTQAQLSVEATRNVLTASLYFEPEAVEKSLVADVTVTDLPAQQTAANTDAE